MSTVTLHHADALEVLTALPDASVHAVVTDPPYGLSNTTPAKVAETITRWAAGERGYVPTVRAGGFMSQSWDAFVPPPELWDQVLRVLKPGGHLFCFAGARTQGLMDTSIRFAGFDIRDNCVWVTAQSMPKAKGQLKPAHEPIIVARRPFTGSAKANHAIHGTGTLRTDAARIPHRSAADLAESVRKNQHADFGTAAGQNKVYGDYSMVEVKNYDGSGGRWPTNVFWDERRASELDAQSGITVSRKGNPRAAAKPGEGWGMTATGAEYDDAGGASRFFYVAKAGAAERPEINGVRHPTVKPLSLLRELVKLAAEPGQTIVEPFAGSGTTVEAALLEDVNVIAVEREADYIPLIQYRIDRAHQILGTTAEEPGEVLF